MNNAQHSLLQQAESHDALVTFFMLHNILNKYFELKNSWGCRPNSNYLLSSVAS